MFLFKFVLRTFISASFGDCIKVQNTNRERMRDDNIENALRFLETENI